MSKTESSIGALAGAADQLASTVMNRAQTASGAGPAALFDDFTIDMLNALPAAVYLTDPDGKITYYNRAAARLWGREPKLGEEGWCGSYRLFWPDGRPMAHDECPMAVALKERRTIDGEEAMAGRPDGTRFPFLAYPRPLYDRKGDIAGALNLLVDITQRKEAEASTHWLAAIVEFSEDAIYTVDLASGAITSWNDAARRLYGYTAEEAIGMPLSNLLPPERRLEEREFTETLRRGDRVANVETLRKRKNGETVEISLSVSPIFDITGRLIGSGRIARDISVRRQTEQKLRESEERFRGIFEQARVAIWDQDFTDVTALLRRLRTEGVEDLRAHLNANPDLVEDAIRRIRITDLNEYTLELFKAPSRASMQDSLEPILLPETRRVIIDELVTLWNGGRRFEAETVVSTFKGERLDVVVSISFNGPDANRTLVTLTDVSALKAAERAAREQTRRFETLNAAAKSIAANLDLEMVVQKVTDAATALSGAKFGAFFYNTVDEEGEALMLYALSGAPKESFEKFGLPRVTPIFAPTFHGEGVVRSDDIRKDPRYGHNAPNQGMPKGHLPVVSYLAVPVIARSGEVIGGLFFAHDKPGMFSDETESLVSGIASHAAIAIDNARLHRAAQDEIVNRRKAEAAKELLLSEIRHRVKNTLTTTQALAAQSFLSAEPQEHDTFSARLEALARAHDLLSNHDWDHAAIDELVDRAIAPYRVGDTTERFELDGDFAVLDAEKSMLFSLALHELATNSIKYGALSAPDGVVTIHWRRDGESGVLNFDWRERGGPPVSPPRNKGFGTALIERAFLGVGRTQLLFEPEGLVCQLEIAL